MLSSHAWRTRIVDIIGVFINILLLPCGTYCFIYLSAQRLDGANTVSYFITLIPVWVAAVPFIAYILLTGLAAQNTRINKCEKFTLSLMVPIGFIITLILLIFYFEGSFDPSDENGARPKLLKIIFVPYGLSIISLYLYLRCLVRPVKI